MLYLDDSAEMCNLAVDTTFFACDKDLNNLMKRLEYDELLAVEWFHNNNATCWYLVINIKMFWFKMEME